MTMAKLEIEEKTLKQNSLLIPVAVALGTLLAIVAYTYLPDNTALITIFSGAIIVALITYAFLKKKKEQ
jgi:VIT1/CCC1 family predicted Fe2+/Mn2+ transporter